MNKIAVILSFLLGLFIGSVSHRPDTYTQAPDIILRHDTVRITEPVAISVKTVDTVYLTLPAQADTVRVPIPIEQKEYSTPEYSAWVSGYRPALDSLRLNLPVIERTRYRPSPQQRVSVGIQAGYGITQRGLQPYIGVGVAYRLL